MSAKDEQLYSHKYQFKVIDKFGTTIYPGTVRGREFFRRFNINHKTVAELKKYCERKTEVKLDSTKPPEKCLSDNKLFAFDRTSNPDIMVARVNETKFVGTEYTLLKTSSARFEKWKGSSLSESYKVISFEPFKGLKMIEGAPTTIVDLDPKPEKDKDGKEVPAVPFIKEVKYDYELAMANFGSGSSVPPITAGRIINMYVVTRTKPNEKWYGFKGLENGIITFEGRTDLPRDLDLVLIRRFPDKNETQKIIWNLDRIDVFKVGTAYLLIADTLEEDREEINKFTVDPMYFPIPTVTSTDEIRTMAVDLHKYFEEEKKPGAERDAIKKQKEMHPFVRLLWMVYKNDNKNMDGITKAVSDDVKKFIDEKIWNEANKTSLEPLVNNFDKNVKAALAAGDPVDLSKLFQVKEPERKDTPISGGLLTFESLISLLAPLFGGKVEETTKFINDIANNKLNYYGKTRIAETLRNSSNNENTKKAAKFLYYLTCYFFFGKINVSDNGTIESLNSSENGTIDRFSNDLQNKLKSYFNNYIIDRKMASVNGKRRLKKDMNDFSSIQSMIDNDCSKWNRDMKRYDFRTLEYIIRNVFDRIDSYDFGNYDVLLTETDRFDVSGSMSNDLSKLICENGKLKESVLTGIPSSSQIVLRAMGNLCSSSGKPRGPSSPNPPAGGNTVGSRQNRGRGRGRGGSGGGGGGGGGGGRMPAIPPGP